MSDAPRNGSPTTCFRCGRRFRDGEPFWSLYCAREVTAAGIVRVLGTESQWARLCSRCSPEEPTIDNFLGPPCDPVC